MLLLFFLGMHDNTDQTCLLCKAYQGNFTVGKKVHCFQGKRDEKFNFEDISMSALRICHYPLNENFGPPCDYF